VGEYADVLVVNDCSSDNTNYVVKERKYDLVTHIFNLGYGNALQLGYKYAVRRGYKYVIQMDGDGQHDTCNVRRLYDELRTRDGDGRYPDIVLGSRFMPDSAPFKVSALKKFAFAYFGGILKLATGRHFYDPTTGLQGLGYGAFLYYSKYNQFDDRYPDANVILHMQLKGYAIREVPAVMHERISGTSMHSGIIKPGIYMVRMTISVLAVLVRDKLLKLEPDRREDNEVIWKR
jgi:glycosyltransferase involved in cell wall biosynthesis